MQFNISYNIMSLVLLMVLIWRFYSQKEFPLISNVLYGILLIVCFFDILFDTLSVISLTFIESFGYNFAFFTTAIYYVLQVGLPVFLVMYILALLSNEIRIRHYVFFVYAIPAVTLLILLCVLIPMGKVFVISPNGDYARGSFANITYFSFALYAIMGLVVVYMNRVVLSKEVVSSFALLLLIMSASVAIQFIYPSILLTGMGITCAFLIMSSTLQNPLKMIDPTTGCYNYEAFQLYFKGNLSYNRRSSMIIAELHGLRNINTVYSMKEGDRLLREFAEFLSANTKNWVFRIEGKRFVVISQDKNSYNSTLESVKSVIDSKWPLSDGGMTRLNVTVRYIENCSDLKRGAMAINVIDLALSDNRSKHVLEIDNESLQKYRRKAKLTQVIRNSAVNGSGFYLVYQPIYNVTSHQFTSAEALLRFYHPEFGTVLPGEFLPMVEKSTLNVSLDETVIKILMKDIASGYFRVSGLNRVHFNLSTASFARDSIISQIIGCIDNMEIEPSFLAIEATETSASSSDDAIEKYMKRLHEKGVVLVLDDYGTGYSNITRLLSLPFDITKIDRSLLLGKKEMYTGVIKAVRNTSDIIVAEGVETKEQAEFVESLGVDEIQGFYYAKPMIADEFAEFVRQKNSIH